MEFMDENTLYAEYLEILRKLYIVRDSHNIASDFSCLETIRQCFKTSNLAALNQREQQLLLRLFPAVKRIAVVMSGQASEEVLRYCTANMDAYERAFCLLLSDIYDSRGTLNARLHNFELSPEYVNKENSRFVKRVLGFVLRYFGYSSAVELIPASFDIQSFEMMLMGKYNEILEINKSYAAVVSVWIQNLDAINVILARLMVHGELPSGLIDSLPYECIEFLTFLENAVHRKIEKREPDLQTRKARFSAAYNEIFYILAIKGIWEDAQNPPYSYTPEMLLDDVFSEDDDRLDRRAQNFLRARALQFERYRNIFRLRDPRSFVRAYNSLQPEDQAFVSVYASLLAFYENHGRNSFKEDSWYVPYFYKRLSPSACAFAVQEEPSRPDTEYTKDESGAYEPETPDTSEESLVSGADYPEKQEVSENTSDEGRSESTRSENDSDRALLFDTREIFSKEQLSNFFVDRYFSLSDETLKAYQTSIDIFYKLGIAYKNNPHSDSFDYQAVWRHLLQAGDSTLSQEEKAFVDDRYAGMALYSSTMNMPASTALKVMASLKEDDLGFLLALLVLKSVKPKKDERSDKNGQQAIKTAEDESRESNGDDVSSRVEVKVKSLEDASRDAHTDSSADREINREDHKADNEAKSNYSEEGLSALLKYFFGDDLDPLLNEFSGMSSDSENSAKNRSSAEEGTSNAAVSSQRVINQNIRRSFELTRAIFLKLGLTHEYSEDYDVTEYRSLRKMFSDLFSLDNFIRLEKDEQLFIFGMKSKEDLLVELTADKNSESSASKVQSLSDEDYGFYKYLCSIKYIKN